MRFNRWPFVALVVLTACTVSERKVSIARDNGGSAGHDSSAQQRGGSDGGGSTNRDTEAFVGGSPNGGNAPGSGGSTPFATQLGGSTGNTAPQGGSTASSSGAGGSTTSGGTSNASCPESCTGATPYCVGGQCVACTGESSPRCIANTPEYCENGIWTRKPACSGSAPVCNAGACGGLRLQGKLHLLPTTQNGAVRLVNARLSSVNRTCSSESNPVCITDFSISP
jgi:hypothetical protein